MPIGTPTGNMIVNIGGGSSEAAVISMYGVVVSSSVRVAGNKFDEAIASYIRRKYSLMIGEQTAEQVKIAIGSALPLEEPVSIEVRGRDQVAGLPRSITVTSDEVTDALAAPLAASLPPSNSGWKKTPPDWVGRIISIGACHRRGRLCAQNGSFLRGDSTPARCRERHALYALAPGKRAPTAELQRPSSHLRG
jgi:rod shape-determining protein MreB